ncbi:unnamed protein product [Blepharisma stoltei]|uniref:Helicase ATP-binding domain-containing protein n=1 Tax=Blepharisma stoltei TaxID=1481888 RepID=A0AAU9JAE9_9CILI|nr:unnamed protein product [Blepharisma stoltei]
MEPISEQIKKLLEEGGQGIIEMHPERHNLSSLISLITLYKKSAQISKIIICTKNIEEVDEILKRLKQINFDGLAFGILHKKGLCLNNEVNSKERIEVESECLELCNASQGCSYYENFKEKPNFFINGVLTSKELKDICELAGICPYFLQRRALSQAEVIVCTHQYFFQSGFSDLKSTLNQKNAILFLDSHNLDSTILDECSINLNLNLLSESLGNIKAILQILETTDQNLKQNYYNAMKNNLKSANFFERSLMAISVPDSLMERTVPGQIRKPEYFLGFIKRVAVHLRKLLRSKEPKIYSGSRMLYDLKVNALIEPDCLKFAIFSLHALFTLFSDILPKEYYPLQLLCRFCTILANSSEGFIIVFEPHPESQNIYSPVLQLTCLDATFCLSPILSSFSSSLFVTATCTPPEIFSKLLGLSPSFKTELSCSSIYCPLMLTKGSDQLAVSAKEEKSDEGVIRNYGDLLLELADTIPDGIICFVTGYKYLEDIVLKWNETGLLYRLLDHKLVFFESRDVRETQIALYNFKLACSSGRGAVLFCVTNGYAVDAVSIFSAWCKCVVIFGVPYQDVLSRVLKARLTYIKEKYSIEESEMLNFDSMRQTVYCMSQALRPNNNYALQIFADKRYVYSQKKDKLPKWIQEKLKPNFSSLSTDALINISRQFLRTAANKINLR